MCNSFFLHIEWSLNIAFVNQFYCMHHGIGFKIIEFLQTFAMFSIGGWAAHGMVFSFRLLIYFTVIYLFVSIFLDALASLAFKLSVTE